MTEEARTLSPAVKSSTTKLSALNSKELLEDESGREGSNSIALNGDVNQNDSKVATDAPNKTPDHADECDNQTEPQNSESDKRISPIIEHSDVENSRKITIDGDLSVIKVSPKASQNHSSTAVKSKARRRSSGIPEHRTKKIHKKASKAKMTHIDAKPGDYFYVRLKGYPLWPAIVCDETMLPQSLLKTRPVTAARADGTYRSDFMDGAPKAKDRSFPVMYLSTNEFGWIPNYDLLEIDFDEVANVTGSMRKDLVTARQLAAERHDLNYFKEILKSFMEASENDRLEHEKVEEEKVLPKEKKDNSEKKKAPRKSKKSRVTFSNDEDSVMPELNATVNSEDLEANYLPIKRPAEEPLEGPPKKRTTIKLTTKTKPEAMALEYAKTSESKKNKSEKSGKPEKIAKVKKIKVSLAPTASASTEPEQLTIEEKRVKRQKEILFLRHKLQKGLLAKDQEVKKEDMKLMSEFIEKLEAYSDLEATVIRQTKINKVLKAILKIPKIPLENEYKFKPRSQSLLEQWNKLQVVDSGDPGISSTNGTNPDVKIIQEEENTVNSELKSIAKKENVANKIVEMPTKISVSAVDDVVGPLPDESKKASAALKDSEP